MKTSYEDYLSFRESKINTCGYFMNQHSHYMKKCRFHKIPKEVLDILGTTYTFVLNDEILHFLEFRKKQLFTFKKI